MYRSFIALICLALFISACAKSKPKVAPTIPTTRTLLPQPAKIDIGSGAPFVIKPATVITFDGAAVRPIAAYLAELIGVAAGPAMPMIKAASEGVPAGAIQLALKAGASPAEGYDLEVTADGVTVVASEPAGLFYGVQTLRQLMPWFIEYDAVRADKARPVSIPPVRIVDAPRFQWRGAMLDVARHFFTVDEVKRYIDLLAAYKINRLHLHLADDQGWRIEIKSWPNLTTRGGSTEVGGGPGGFYTQEQFADLVTYAQSRFITIVPEIDTPGHTNAALASYPELNCNGVAPPLYTEIRVGFSALCIEKEVTYTFLDDVIREISGMIPGPYFHMGGDEVKTLTQEQYAAFVERVQGIVQKHGKTMIGWDEVAATNLLPASIVQHWRPKTTPKSAVEKGTKVILSPGDRMYLDMKYDPSTAIGLTWAGLISVRQAYDWEPDLLLEGVRGPSILGVEAPLWAETMGNIRDVEFLAFPRVTAVAEIGWSARERRDWDSFKDRLAAQGPRWTALGINFHRTPEIPWRH